MDWVRNLAEGVGVVLAPVVVAYVIAVLFLARNSWRGLRKKKAWLSPLKLNSEPLHEQPLLWLAIITPSVCLAILGGIIVSYTGVSLTPEGVRRFLSLGAPIIPIAALGVAGAALVARAHATVQKAQALAQGKDALSEARSNNSFKNFIEHRKYFQEFLSENSPKHLTESEVDYVKIYKILFPKNCPEEVNTTAYVYKGETLVDFMSNKIERVFFGVFDGQDVGSVSISSLHFAIGSEIRRELIMLGFPPVRNQEIWGDKTDLDSEQHYDQLSLVVGEYLDFLNKLAYLCQLPDYSVERKVKDCVDMIGRGNEWVSPDLHKRIREIGQGRPIMVADYLMEP